MPYPTQYKYTKEHEWVDAKGDTATIGITDYAQTELGDVVFVELPKVGAAVTAGKTFGTVESVKRRRKNVRPRAAAAVTGISQIQVLRGVTVTGSSTRAPGCAQVHQP